MEAAIDIHGWQQSVPPGVVRDSPRVPSRLIQDTPAVFPKQSADARRLRCLVGLLPILLLSAIITLIIFLTLLGMGVYALLHFLFLR